MISNVLETLMYIKNFELINHGAVVIKGPTYK